MVTVEFRGTADHKARGPVQCRPEHQKSQCLEQALIVLSMIERPSLGIDVVEVRKSLKVGAQMSLAERALKARPTSGLRIITAAERIKCLDSRILPVEIWPLTSSMLSRLNRLQSFFLATGRN